MPRFKATANIQWIFEAEKGVTPKTAAFENLKSILGDKCGDVTFMHIGKIDKLKTPKTRIVLGEFSPEDVLPYVGAEQDRRKYIVDDNEYMVKMNSQRYFIFRASQKCVSCGLLGTKMLLEQHPNDTTPHFNMYGEEDGTLVLMTKDHIQAKSTGGADRHSNYQTMCSICNQLKGSDPLTIAQTKELREIYDANHKQLTKKALHQLVIERKLLMCGDQKPEKISKPKQQKAKAKDKGSSTVFTKCDIHIYSREGEFFGAAVYDTVSDAEHVASVKKGTVIYPTGSDDKRICVPFGKTHFSLYHGLVEYMESQKECKSSKAKECSDTVPNCSETESPKTGG